ncbi:hypothetical protein ACLB2K_062047 [Fragaria x ananassa]
MFSQANTELGRGRVNHLYSSSLEKFVVVASTAGSLYTPLPFATRSSCYFSSHSSSSELVGELESLSTNSNVTIDSTPEKEELMMKMISSGALPPLMHALIRSESERTRHDAALVLCNLMLVESNRVKLVKLNSALTLLALSKALGSAGRVLLILCNLAICGEGRSAMLDANAVECLGGC